MDTPLDEHYLEWLYKQVGSVRTRNPSKTYWSLFRQLYKKEFVWLIPNDDNRLEDGRDLRYEFIDAEELNDVDPDWMDLGCSMLELMIGLARLLAFEAEGEERHWFWTLIENLDLDQYNDAVYDNRARKRIEETLDTVIWRTYSHDGRGGFFPLEHPEQDQADVELWYQLNLYIMENNYI